MHIPRAPRRASVTAVPVGAKKVYVCPRPRPPALARSVVASARAQAPVMTVVKGLEMKPCVAMPDGARSMRPQSLVVKTMSTTPTKPARARSVVASARVQALVMTVMKTLEVKPCVATSGGGCSRHLCGTSGLHQQQMPRCWEPPARVSVGACACVSWECKSRRVDRCARRSAGPRRTPGFRCCTLCVRPRPTCALREGPPLEVFQTAPGGSPGT